MSGDTRQMVEVVAIRMTPEQLAKVDDAAAYHGMTRSDLIRTATLVWIKDTPKWWREARRRAVEENTGRNV